MKLATTIIFTALAFAAVFATLGPAVAIGVLIVGLTIGFTRVKKPR